MSGYDILASTLGVKVKIEGVEDTIYPPIPPSPPQSPEPEPGVELPHTYIPLNHDEIRLLILNPGSGDEPISCFLENYPVTKPKRFAALSYAWGVDTPDTRRRILLDGYQVDVGANLYAFLTNYRAEDKCGVLWVDAVCINQDDLVERRAQIHLMKRVYEGAERVIIWLGESTPTISAAIGRMIDIYESWWSPILNRTGSAHRSLATITDQDIDDFLRDRNSETQHGPRDSGTESWRAGIQEIFSLPWWSRIWVYQEATAPCCSGAEVLIGPHRIQFNAILTVYQIIRSIAWRGHPDSLFTADRQHGIHPAAYMQTYTALRKRHQVTGLSRFLRLSDLLSALRRFDATNPRDKLYALIPTSLDGVELLDIAYDRPVEDVYANAAWSMIQTYRSLDVLGHCSPPSQDDGAVFLELPSWVPNWTAKSTVVPFFKRGLTAPMPSAPKEFDAYGVHVDGAGVDIGKLYCASGDSVPEASIDATGRILSCAGFVFDRINAVSPDSGIEIFGTEMPQTWAAWLRTKPIAQSPRVIQRFSDIALSRILVADCDKVAIDVGMRRRGKSGEVVPAVAEASSSRRSYYMDITGPHPASFRRHLVVTGKGYLGLVAEGVQKGDLVCIVMGSQVPLVLREVQQHHIFVGEAFIDGIMDGEALEERGKNGENMVFAIQ